jgi:DnaJ-class molecular chaperone
MKPGDEAPPGTPGTGENLCRACNGTGRTEGGECPTCLGSGKINEGIGGA